MAEIAASTIPAFLVILLGAALFQRRFIPSDTWAALQKLNYYLFLPAMFVGGLAGGDDFAATPLIGLIVAVAFVLAAASAAVWLWYVRDTRVSALGPQLLEAAVRANVHYGMAISLAVGGSSGLQIFLIAAATYLPTVVVAGGVFSQLIGQRDSDAEAEQEQAIATAFRLLARNPIAVGIVLGAGLNVFGIPLAAGLDELVRAGGFAAIPIGLLATGAALSVAAAQNALEAARRTVVAVVALKLLLLPMSAGLVALIFDLSGAPATALIVIAALPGVVPRFTVVDGPAQSLLPGITTIATVLSVLTIPVVLWLFS